MRCAMCSERPGPRAAAPYCMASSKVLLSTGLPGISRGLEQRVVHGTVVGFCELGLSDTDGITNDEERRGEDSGQTPGKPTFTRQMEPENLGKVAGKKGGCMPQGREGAGLTMGPGTNQTTGNCRWKARPGRTGHVASRWVLDQGTWDVWAARLSPPEPPDPMLPASLPGATALPMVLGPGAQHMAPLYGFWHRRGIYFLDEAAKIVLHLCWRAWYSRSRHFLTGPGKSNSKWIQGGRQLRSS